jgi:hypothetical protein
MSELTCMIEGCQAKAYAPAGTQSVCKEHFLSFLTWRRRKGSQMFTKYAAMTMEERNAVVVEWQKTVAIVDVATPPAPQT